MTGSVLTAGMLKPRAAPLSGLPATERFAVQLCEFISHLIGSLSPVPFRVAPDGIEEGRRPEAADGMAEATLKSGRVLVPVFIECDRLLVFALTDAALGGTGNEPPASPGERPLSAIEKDIRDLLVSRIMEALPEQVATGFGIEPLTIVSDPSIEADASAFLCFRLLVNVFSYSGEIRLGLGYDVLSACVARAQAPDTPVTTLREGLADCLTHIAVMLPSESLTVSQLSRLVPGQLLTLRSSVATPVLGVSGGVQIFAGMLTRSGGRLAVKVI